MLSDNAFPALVLNANFMALSYHPISTWSWQNALKAVFMDRVTVVSEYDEFIRSPSWKMRLPSVIALKEYVPRPSTVAFTRFNVFLRDRFTCLYCGKRLPADQLTFDHVIPRSHGAKTTWLNTATACEECNTRKANRTPRQAGMVLLRVPHQPTHQELDAIARTMPRPRNLHKEWIDYLYWDSELEA